jgi:hypothetical protein
MECIYCKKIYSNVYTLSTHQKTARYCLIKQNEKKGITTNEFYHCEFCSKELTTKNRLETHKKVCKVKKSTQTNDMIYSQQSLQSELNEAKLKIKELEEKIKEKERTPPKISNKTINNIDTQINNSTITIYQIMNPDHVTDVFQKHYNLDTLLGGQKALARFINDEFLKKQDIPVYICGDRARQKFYMIKDGKKEEDPDCENIIGLSIPGFPHVRDVYQDALFTKHEKVTEGDIQENYRTLSNLDKDRMQFKGELSKITATHTEPESTSLSQKIAEQFKYMRDGILPYEHTE